MATEPLFRDDAYMRSADATVVAATPRGIELDRTVFYPTGGGQPGDLGLIRTADGAEIPIAEAIKVGEAIVHVPVPGEDGGAPEIAAGAKVTAEINWDVRYPRMRMHTCLHLLSAVLDYPVTGGSVGEVKARLDFDIPEATLDKEQITADLNRIIAEDHPVTTEWITDEQLAAQPDLVKTMSVKPPMGAGRVRLIRIGDDQDLQPCGGTHVAQTGEIGTIVVTKIKKKGRQNRRVSIAFAAGT
ncbi:MAG: alanyl-tRNA editing protein [Alphaproteobacteria bacterium]|jgi:misacylated tRNA(Ala) deacylase|nr:alanyl-tRNA editing protein [Alphaproteobacteria bacterium]MBT5861237.1 alanyl-tRNA editing protein [Alphaproteobacteria bacterium]